MLSIVAFVMTCISVIATLFCVIVNLFVLFKLITSRQSSRNITFVTAIYFHTSLLFCGCCICLISLNTFLGDLQYTMYPDSNTCRAFANLLVISLSLVLNGFPIEALSRCFLVVYSQNTYLRSIRVMLLFIVGLSSYSIIAYVIGISFYNVKYEPNEFTCTVDFLAWKGILYIFVLNYMVPIAILMTVYFIVVKDIRQSSHIVHNYRSRRNKRDFRVLQRILILTVVAALLGMPGISLWVVGMIIHEVYPFGYRIEILGFAIFPITISVSLILINPQIKSLFQRRIGHNQVEPVLVINRQELPHVTQSNIVKKSNR